MKGAELWYHFDTRMGTKAPAIFDLGRGDAAIALGGKARTMLRSTMEFNSVGRKPVYCSPYFSVGGSRTLEERTSPGLGNIDDRETFGM